MRNRLLVLLLLLAALIWGLMAPASVEATYDWRCIPQWHMYFPDLVCPGPSWPTATPTPVPTVQPTARPTQTPMPTRTPVSTSTPTAAPMTPTAVPQPVGTLFPPGSWLCDPYWLAIFPQHQVSCPPVNTPTPVGPRVVTVPVDLAGERQEMRGLVNAARAGASVAPLRLNGQLNAIAQSYAERMARENFLSHVAPDGTGIVDRFDAGGYLIWTNWNNIGENANYGPNTVQWTFDSWMNSPSHRALILSGLYRDMGLGHAIVLTDAPWRDWWTLELGCHIDERGECPRGG